MLREELLAMSLHDDWVLMIDGEKQQAAHLTPKKQLLQTLGRSPDRASAFVFALSQPVLDEDCFW